MTVDVAAAMAKRGFKELTDEDLRGQGIEEVKCRACSGYGNCGYKTFRLHKGDPYSVCNLRFQKLQEADLAATGEAAEAE